MNVTLVFQVAGAAVPRAVAGVQELGRKTLGGSATSERHAVLDTTGNYCTLRDLGSTNGTVVGGVRVRSGETRVLVDGTEIRFGDVRAIVQIDGDRTAPKVVAAPNFGQNTAALAHAALAVNTEAALEFFGPCIVVAHRGLPAASLVLGEGRVLTLGRNGDLAIDDETVSSAHAEVRRDGSQVFVRDVGSRHGVHVAGMPIPPFAWHPWPYAAAITLGRAVLVVHGLPRPVAPQTPVVAKISPPAAVPYAAPIPIAIAPQNFAVAPLDPDAPTAATRKRPKERPVRERVAVVALVALLVVALATLLRFLV